MAESNGAHDAVALEEYKSLVSERRFVMTSYMQAIAFYIALVGFVGTQYFTLKTAPERVFLLIFMFIANTCAWLGARKFREMSDHTHDREVSLSMSLGIQPPGRLTWGYHYGLLMGSAVQLGVVLESIRLMTTFAR